MANPLNAAKKVVDGRSSGGRTDLNEDVKETFKQAIYEVQNEERGRSDAESSPGSNAGRLALIGLGIAIGRQLGKMGTSDSVETTQREDATQIDIEGEDPQQYGDSSGDQSRSSGTGLGRLVLLVGLGAVGYAVYRRRSRQSTTHLEHEGETRHTSASDLPESETVPAGGEPTNAASSTESESEGEEEYHADVGVEEDVVAPDPEESESDTAGSESSTESDEESEEESEASEE